jgi:orotidine-5'-phosphate decarboxylase
MVGPVNMGFNMTGPLQKYTDRVNKANSLLCVGLDAQFSKLPERFQKLENPQFEFNKWIIEQTHAYTAAYKPNLAFYEARGDQGLTELKLTLEYLQNHHPDILTIADAKRADIDSTNLGYVNLIFDWLDCDAITINPYLGQQAIQPFLDRADKLSIVLCRTSNAGSGEFQDLMVDDQWNTHHNCMLVVGATYPEELAIIRQTVGDMTFLVPGIGAQGGDLAAVMKAGLTSNKQGLIINSARGIIFAEDPSQEAQKLQTQINSYRI